MVFMHKLPSNGHSEDLITDPNRDINVQYFLLSFTFETSEQIIMFYVEEIKKTS